MHGVDADSEVTVNLILPVLSCPAPQIPELTTQQHNTKETRERACHSTQLCLRYQQVIMTVALTFSCESSGESRSYRHLYLQRSPHQQGGQGKWKLRFP